MRSFIRHLSTLGLAAALSLSMVPAAMAKDSFKVAWSIYVGWMPWDYAAKEGIIKKWADKYGIDIEVVQINDYIESINQYTAGGYDVCTMTNMDALTIPAAGGVDSTAIIIGDFSNGNDGIIMKGASDLAKIKGQNANLVELSVSHYLLARALETVNLKERDLTVVNTSDADMVGAASSPDVTSLVTWNPQLAEILGSVKDTHLVFDSSQIPGEIIDMLVVKTETLEKHPELGKALAGAWFEVMSIMSKDDEKGKAARSFMAKASGTDLAGYESQMKTTKFFFDPTEAVGFTTSADLIKTMKLVAGFSFDHGILGEGAKSAEAIGMGFPGGKTLGDTGNLKLRFSETYMQMAAEGKL